MKTFKSFLLFVILLPLIARADDELYSSYAKVSINHIIHQPSKITIDAKQKGRNAVELQLYGGDNVAYTIETGVAVPIEDGNLFKMGVSWYDLLNQGESRRINRPYRLEPFADYYFQFSHDIYFKVGAGYKVVDSYLFKNNGANGEKYRDSLRTNPILDKITARFALGAQWGDIGLSLEHNSQWFSGKPINDKWEYETTSVNLSYTF